MNMAHRSAHELTDSQRTRGILALMASTTIGLIGQFMFSPLLVFLLQARGLPPSQIGLFSATVWLGILVATPQTGRIVARIGRRNALIASLAIPCLTMTGVASTESLWIWTPLNFIAGMATSMRWVLAESCIAELVPAHRRGRIIGMYQTLLGAALVSAPMLLAWLGPTRPGTRWVSLGLLVAGLLITLATPRLPAVAAGDTRTGMRGLWSAARTMPLAAVAGFVGGFFELGIAALLPVYGLAIGLGTAGAAMLLSASGLGSMLAMLPLGEAADRFSATRVMRVCALTTLLASMALPLVAFSPAVAWPLAFLWGAAGGALYTLTMIEIGHRHHGSRLISATSLLVVSYTLGSLCGPIASGMAIEWSVDYAVPGIFSAVAAIGWFSLRAATVAGTSTATANESPLPVDRPA
ncbi:MAG: MFS transporter [Burkholderiaceae bacterium]